MGGLFIGSCQPLPSGSVLKVQLFSPADAPDGSAVLARGIGRWRQLWHGPRGMGVQFLDFAGLGQRRLESWLDAIALAASALAGAAWAPTAGWHSAGPPRAGR